MSHVSCLSDESDQFLMYMLKLRFLQRGSRITDRMREIFNSLKFGKKRRKKKEKRNIEVSKILILET